MTTLLELQAEDLNRKQRRMLVEAISRDPEHFREVQEQIKDETRQEWIDMCRSTDPAYRRSRN